MRIDLNSDLGESFGAWRMGDDDGVLPHVTSANVACGFHAGDPATMRRTVARALEHGVAIGAHPGLPDLAGFGRRAMDVTAEETYDMVVYQAGALAAFCAAAGTRMAHVKPHGALYNMAAARRELADAIARAVRDVDPALALVGLAGSALVDAARDAGLRAVSEVFADRQYTREGTLVPRSRPDALVHDPDEAVARALRMARDGRVATAEGDDLALACDSICIHGDGPHATLLARRLRAGLAAAGITVAAPAARA